MKKASLMAVLALAGLALTGCSGLVVTNNGFASVPPGIFFSEMKAASFVQDRVDNKALEYEVVKTGVTADAETTNFLMLFSMGDASYATLKEKALRNTGADDLINIEVDYSHNNILGIINKVKTQITGTAIKYKE